MILVSSNIFCQFSECDYAASQKKISDLKVKFKIPQKDKQVYAAQLLSMAYRLHCIEAPVDSVLFYLNKSAEVHKRAICGFVTTWEQDSTLYISKGKKPLFVIDNYELYKFDYKSLCSDYTSGRSPDYWVSKTTDKYQLIYKNDQGVREYYSDAEEKNRDIINDIMTLVDSNHQEIVLSDLEQNMNNLNEGDLYVIGLVILHARNKFIKKASSYIDQLIASDKLYFSDPMIDRFCCREIEFSYNGQYCPKNEDKTRELIMTYFPSFFTE